MKFTIKSNGKINDCKIIKYLDDSGIECIEIDFTPSSFYSDLEFWLNESETDKFLDYAKMRLSKTSKMKFRKG